MRTIHTNVHVAGTGQAVPADGPGATALGEHVGAFKRDDTDDPVERHERDIIRVAWRCRQKIVCRPYWDV